MLKFFRHAVFETTSIEILSTIAFMTFAMLNVFFPERTVISCGEPLPFHHHIVYILSLIFVAIICFLPVILKEKIRVLRCIICYLAGIFWIWIGLSAVFSCNYLTICSVSGLTIGIGNIYAFIIHLLILHQFKNKK